MPINNKYNKNVGTPITILTATTTGAGDLYALTSNVRQSLAFQAILSVGTASVDIEVSLNGVDVCDTPAATIALSANSDGVTTSAAWGYWRANVTAIAGGGTLTVLASN